MGPGKGLSVPGKEHTPQDGIIRPRAGIYAPGRDYPSQNGNIRLRKGLSVPEQEWMPWKAALRHRIGLYVAATVFAPRNRACGHRSAASAPKHGERPPQAILLVAKPDPLPVAGHPAFDLFLGNHATCFDISASPFDLLEDVEVVLNVLQGGFLREALQDPTRYLFRRCHRQKSTASRFPGSL